jgi:hypothetical protein
MLGPKLERRRSRRHGGMKLALLRVDDSERGDEGSILLTAANRQRKHENEWERAPGHAASAYPTSLQRR